ncbi:Aldo/keto reductase [Rhizodiscina lignyota]|uniref:Aldo/keto reductase n=1 Tax=Rhizodiscina lignyota TaxID=1504668 RepID=A0A9P4M7B0_9PEZI|nr:Aldo/keto reductase [Rhizodiscina lignyota]
MTTNKTAPVLSIGTHTWNTTPESQSSIQEILNVMRKHGIKKLDTARSYGQGESEAVIGNLGLPKEFEVATKAATGTWEGAGKREHVLEGAQLSLDALRISKIPIYFLHAPDETTPVADTMSAIQELYEHGHFEKFGLSNFTRDQVVELHSYAKSNGLVLPTVYQSSYSLAVRLNEEGLFPTLRELGFSIQAYSPMAAGLLAKTPEYIEQGKGSWDPKTPSGIVYNYQYNKPEYMQMLREYAALSEKSGVSRTGLAYRWIRYHSMLDGSLGDEMIIGAASANQLEETLEELEKGPLEPWAVKIIDELWDVVKGVAPVDNLEAIRHLVKKLSAGNS